MKNILGLDLGVSSIGWAVITTDENNSPKEIAGSGARIVPLSVDETTGFTKGNGESVCSARTMKRSMRRNLDRYQQRRKMLGQLLDSLGMMFDRELLQLPPLKLWDMRSAAANGEKLSLAEIGRVIYHINQKRGYKSSKEESTDKSQSEYLSAISARANEASINNETPGQYFARKLRESAVTTGTETVCNYRVKEKVFPRKAYEDELKVILEKQSAHYPELLNEENRTKIFDTIFYQRPLKSCKHLVSTDEFETKEYTAPDGRKVMSGPRVAPVTSPIAQVCRLWETINNIQLKNSRNKRKAEAEYISDNRKENYIYALTHEERNKLFDYLNTHEQLTHAELLKQLGLKKDDGFSASSDINKGIKGNTTRCELAKALGDHPRKEELLRFNIEIEDSGKADPDTGEVLKKVNQSYLREPLYQLWHTVYSENDKDRLAKVMKEKFGIEDQEITDKLYNIDFRGKGYASKSAKFMCKILPYLEQGFQYSEACDIVGVNHSNSLTKEENQSRELAERLTILKKGELRQPVIEKILNQMIHLVNSLTERYGRFDEITVELARELKQSKNERFDMSQRINRMEKLNKDISDRISEYNLRPSKNKIQKYKMWEESNHCCMYCGQPVGVAEFLSGTGVEKEHVIPRSLFFDDSFSNKVCACRECNAAKGQQTAYDFMQGRGETAFTAYIDRVERLFEEYKKSKGQRGISKTKHDRLLTSVAEIPQDFIERDLRQTQYIAKKAVAILREICHEVHATSGSVTDFFRHSWGYDEILHDLNLPDYKAAGQTETEEVMHHGTPIIRERITGWTKRLDHRHHAIDALVIAQTRQKHITYLNTLNTLRDNSKGNADQQGEAYSKRRESLEKWAQRTPHISVKDATDSAASIAVSFKAGKKATTPGKRIVYKGGKRIVAQTGIIVPRGSLTNESVYGTIKVKEAKIPLAKLFDRHEEICNSSIREAIENRLSECDWNAKKAAASCKKQPITAMISGKEIRISYADCWKEQFVIRYPIERISQKWLTKIVDGGMREKIAERFRETGNDDKAFVRSLSEQPIYSDSNRMQAIRNVRLIAGDIAKETAAVVKRNSEGKAIGYSKFGNNHHIALYVNPDGGVEETVVTMVSAVERRLAGIPQIVTDPSGVWEQIEQMTAEPKPELANGLPLPDRKFLMSLQLNDMFIIGMEREDVKEAIAKEDYKPLIGHLYRVQRISSWYYDFKRSTCTLSDATKEQMANGNYISVRSWTRMKELDLIKVKVDRTGRISLEEDSFLPTDLSART